MLLVRPAAHVGLGLLLVVGGRPSYGGQKPASGVHAGAPRARPTVQLLDGLLTVDAQNTPLKVLLEEIARQSDLTVEGHESLVGRVTIELDQVPLQEGLRRLLRRQSYVLQYPQPGDHSNEPAASHPVKLSLFSQAPGSGRTRAGGVPDALADPAPPEATLVDVPMALAILASSEDALEREDAVEVLRDSGQPDVVGPLSRVALADEDEDVRAAAIDALGDIGGKDAAQALSVALQDEEPGLRAEAVEALGHIGGQAAAQVLAIALQDADVDVRYLAVESLGEIGGETSIALLERALGDADEDVRDIAAELLRELRR